MTWETSPRLDVLWGPRLETATEIATRLQDAIARLDALDPALGRLYPMFQIRAVRASDYGPVLALSLDDLAIMIDRQGRSDPPARPAPVSDAGYNFGLAPLAPPRSPGDISVGVTAGGVWSQNRFNLCAAPDAGIWRPGPLAAMVDAMVDVWDADSATVTCPAGLKANGSFAWRPWLAWARDGGEEEVRVQGSEDFDPEEETPHRGGRLRVWARD